MLRLGHGAEGLESDKDFSKFGRVQDMLKRRLRLSLFANCQIENNLDGLINQFRFTDVVPVKRLNFRSPQTLETLLPYVLLEAEMSLRE